MHAGLMTLIVIVTAVIGTGPSRSEEPRLADKTPDGAQLIDLYKAARTVADVEAANGKVKDEVLTVQSVPSDLARLHVAKMTVCEESGDVAPRSDRCQGASLLCSSHPDQRRASWPTKCMNRSANDERDSPTSRGSCSSVHGCAGLLCSSVRARPTN